MPHHRLAPGAVGVLLLAASPAVAGRTPRATGGMTVRVLSTTPGDLVAHTSFQPRLAPGASFTGAVELGNTTAHAMRATVDAVDGLTSATSGAVYAPRATQARHAGTWLTPSVRAIALQPGEIAQVGVRIAVPTDALPGTYLAGLAAEHVTPKPPGGGFGVTQVLRTVVGVLVTVPGRGSMRPHAFGVRLRPNASTGRSNVLIRLGNRGRKLGRPLLTVRIRRPGTRGLTVRRRLDTLLPGDTIRYALPWPRRLASSTYEVSVQIGDARRRFVHVRYPR